MSMKDDKLKQAINELPEFDAPDVWNEIEKELPTKKKRFIFPIVIVLVLTVSAYFVISGLDQKEELNIADSSVTEGQLIAFLSKPDNNTIVNIELENEISKINPVYVTENENDFLIEESTAERDIENIISVDKTDFIVEVPESNGDNTSFFKIDYFTKTTYEEIGENLVRNPSFEDYNVCPSGINGQPSKRLLPDWAIPSKGTPDYFNTCCDGDAGVPNNFAGKIKPHSGNAYSGIILRKNFTRDNRITGEKPVIYREYIQNELKIELEAGKSYRIKFWICNSSKSRFAVDQVGAAITYESGRVKDKEVLEFYPVVENTSGNFLSNQNYWVAIEGVYEAIGGEKYLTIGNFKNNFSTRYIMQNGNSEFNYAYYYIDDVSVVEVMEIVESVPVNDSSSYESVIQSDDQAYDF